MKNPIKLSKSKVRKAGVILKENKNNNEALEVLSQWRADHALPLEKAYIMLGKITTKIDNKIIVAKRLKRTPSIIDKLHRFSSGKESMKLDRMNDIGGCRAIVSTFKILNKISKEIVKSSPFKLQKDYIKNPKESGYRSVHLIGKLPNKNGDDKFIEIQLRTKVQHSWATAIEIIDLFAKQSIKTNSGDKDWSNFFKHSSRLFALLENNSNISLRNIQSVYREYEKYYLDVYYKDDGYSFFMVNKLKKKLQIDKKYKGFTESIKISSEQINKIIQPGYVLITIDEIDGETLGIKSHFYPMEQLKNAIEMYLVSEKEYLSHQNLITALVSTDAIGGVKEAYPNYFADSSVFLDYLGIVTEVYNRHSTYFAELKYTLFYWKNKLIKGKKNV